MHYRDFETSNLSGNLNHSFFRRIGVLLVVYKTLQHLVEAFGFRIEEDIAARNSPTRANRDRQSQPERYL